jgi:hypothetical protein
VRFGVPLDGDTHPVYSNPQARVAIDATIAAWTPQCPPRLWSEEVAEFTRSAVTDFGAKNRAEAVRLMSDVANIAIHTHFVCGHPLERRIVFDGRNVEVYSKEVLSTFISGVESRTRLFRIAGQLHLWDPVRAAQGPRRTKKNNLPYDIRHDVRLRSQGATRSTPRRRHNWMTLAAFGGGCGLTGEEIGNLRYDDVIVGDSHVEVRVRGRRPRRIICRAEWENDIRELMQEPAQSDYLFWRADGSPLRPNTAAPYLLQYSSWDTSFSVERMRSTFIVRHLIDGTSIAHLMAMLGVHTFGTIEKLLPYAVAHALPIDEVVDELRGKGRE